MAPDDALTSVQFERDQQSSNTYCTSLEDLSDLPSGGGVEQSPSLGIVAAISSASVTLSRITIIAPEDLMAVYERHKSESTVLYQSVARAWPKIEVEYAMTEKTISSHVTSEFERYKRCGILEHGFVRLYCKDCQAERVVGFSCKGRGFCPSCRSRRAIQKADRIEREVWPKARVRQWVLTFPHQVRFWLRRSPEVFGDTLFGD
jgi:hypothetical protein